MDAKQNAVAALHSQSPGTSLNLWKEARNRKRDEYARRLKQTRTVLGLTQDEMAELLGISPRKLFNLEKGSQHVSLLERVGLEHLFGCERIT